MLLSPVFEASLAFRLEGQLDPMRTKSIESSFGNITAFVDDVITDQINEFGNHTRPEFAFALSVIEAGMNVFDLGAHIGTFTLPAVQKMRGVGNFLSVEGNPETFDVLVENCSQVASTALTHKFEKIFVAPDQNYGFTFDDKDRGAGHLVALEKEASEDDISIKSLDKLCEDHFYPDFVKIDLEGSEFLSLESATEIFSNNPILYLEVSERQLNRFGHRIQHVNAFLEAKGYKFFVNTGERNAKHDVYSIREIRSLNQYKIFYDVLCIHEDSALYGSLTKAVEKIGLLKSWRYYLNLRRILNFLKPRL